MATPRIALTAFEPFDGTGLNASLEGCRYFLERFAAEIPVRFAALPVEYGRDTVGVRELVARGELDILLHTGQSGRASALLLERVAVNRRYPRDWSGEGRPGGFELIDPEGPESLAATLPTDSLVEAMIAEGIAAEPSDDAGIYLCNHVLYRSLQAAQGAARPPRIGFLHVPRLPQQVTADQPAMTAEAIAQGIAALLRTALKQV